MNNRIALVVEQYNRMASQLLKRTRFGIRYSDKKTRDQIRSFIEWCDEQGVQEIEFATARIYHQKVEMGRGFPRPNSLRSPVLLKNDFYIDLYGWWLKCYVEPERMRVHLERQEERQTELARRRRHVWEKFKERESTAMCLRSPEHSGGFHPHSEHCKRCPSAAPCSTQTGALVQLRSSCTEIGP